MIALLAILAQSAYATGAVEVVSRPYQGLPISVDGVMTGKVTPATLEAVPIGKHTIRVTGTCMAGEQVVHVEDGDTGHARILVAVQQGSIIFEPDPADAEIRIDGEVVGQAPGLNVPVDCGERAIAATMNGYRPAMITVRVEQPETMHLPIKLSALGKGSLTLHVEPADASLYLDGLPLGTGDHDLSSVVAGGHVLRAEAAGYAPAEQQIILDDGQHQDLAFALVASSTVTPLPPAPVVTHSSGWWTSTRKVGVPMAAVGGMASLYGVVQYFHVKGVYSEYVDRHDRWEADRTVPDSYVQDYVDEELLPNRTRLWVASGTGVALLTSGLVLTWGF